LLLLIQVRDLEGMAWHSLQLMVEQAAAHGPDLVNLLRDVLGGG